MSMEALTSELARLTSSLEFWRLLRLTVVAGTVLLAAGTMVAQWMELRRSKELSKRQTELLRLKDEQLQKELAAKDVRIADAAKAAAGANERAGNAMERAARFERETEELRHRNLEMRQQLAATTRTATAVHEQLLPRTLTAEQISELRAVLSKTREKARIPVIATESHESRQLASQIIGALLFAGWDTEREAGTASPPWEGIVLTVEDSERIPAQASLLATELERLGLPVQVTGRQGAPRLHTMASSKTLVPARPPLELLNLWVGEKAAMRGAP